MHAKRTLTLSHSKNLAGGQPRDIYETDFDIIGPSQYRLVHLTETIRVMIDVSTTNFACDIMRLTFLSQVLQEFSSELGPFTVRINNYRLLDAILSYITPSDEIQAKIRRALALFWKRVRTLLTLRLHLLAHTVFSEILVRR